MFMIDWVKNENSLNKNQVAKRITCRLGLIYYTYLSYIMRKIKLLKNNLIEIYKLKYQYKFRKIIK